MKRYLAAAFLGLVVLTLAGCSSQPQKPKVDPVTQAMKQAVAGSLAQVQVVGRTDWDVDTDHNQYWANVTLKNVGGDGQVAMRVAIQTIAPYFGIGQSPTQPVYLHMSPGQTVTQRMTGALSAKKADKAIGVNVEVYPKGPWSAAEHVAVVGNPVRGWHSADVDGSVAKGGRAITDCLIQGVTCAFAHDVPNAAVPNYGMEMGETHRPFPRVSR